MTHSDSNQQQKSGQQANPLSLSDEFLDKLVYELDNDETVGIILGGSYARGEATLYSDVDIARFVRDDLQPPLKSFAYIAGRLVSLSTKTIAGVRSAITRPNQAIFVVPGLQHYRLLLDKDGSLGKLLEEIASFSWEPLQAPANRYASYRITTYSEHVHKLLNAFLLKDELALAYTTAELLYGLTEVIAVQRGVLVKSSSAYYRRVHKAVGANSYWTRYHRIVSGVDIEPATASPVKVRAMAALHLYQETLELLRPVMTPDHLPIAEQAVHIFNEAVKQIKL